MDRKEDINIFKHIFKWTCISAIISMVGSFSAIIITKTILILSSISYNNIYIIPFALAFSGYFVDKYPNLKGPGVDRTLNALNNKLPLNPFVGFLKVILSGITIGLGGSGGKVGPSIQDNAFFADYLYRKFKLRNRKALLISGIAGGLSGDLCAPLGSAIFAAEIVKKEGFEYISCFPAIMSSIFGYILFFIIFGQVKLFNPPTYQFTPMDFPAIFLCAIFCAFIAYIYINTFGKTRRFFDKFSYPQWLKSFWRNYCCDYWILHTSISGLGADIIENFMILKYSIIPLTAILFGKILTTSFTVGTKCS